MTLSPNPNNSKTRADGGGGATPSVPALAQHQRSESAAANAAALSTAPLRPRPEGCAQRPALQVNDPGTSVHGRMRSGEYALFSHSPARRPWGATISRSFLHLRILSRLPTSRGHCRDLHAFRRGQGTGRQMINSGMF